MSHSDPAPMSAPARPDPTGLRPRDAVQGVLESARRTVEDDGLPSCQVAVAVDGELAAFEAFGDATGDNRYVIFSVTKAVTAAAAWMLMGEGVIAPGARVADLVPEFGTNGKQAVTVEHLLTHTAGFSRAPMRPEEGADRSRRLERFASWRLHWEPGTRTEYHPTAADWVLAEVVERASGKPLRTFVAERLMAPLGLPRLQLGVPEEEQGDVLDVRVVGEMSAETAAALERVGASATLAELGPQHLVRFNDPAVRAVGVPGAGAVGSASDVVRFFQALATNPAGLWDPDILREATSVVRNDHLDPWTRVPANRTLGLVVAGDDGNAVLRGFGHGIGPRAFGAMGVGGQVAWTDPDARVSFCYLTNGLDADVVRAFRRQAGLSEAAAACGDVR